MDILGHSFYVDTGRFGPRFLFKSSPKAPAAPDPAKTAEAQSATNKETAYWNAVLNNVNQITPYGNLTYSAAGPYNPDQPPQFTSTITLSPEQQKLYDTQSQQQQRLADIGGQQMERINQAVSTPYSFSGLPAAPNAGDVNALAQRGQDAIMSRLDPQFARDEEALRTRLINQGIGQGSEAYDHEFERFNQAKNDARMQAVLQGQNYGGAESQQQLALRNQAIQEYNAQRNAPLNEYTALTAGQQVQNPNFSSSGYQGAQAPDYANLVNQQYQSQMNQYNQKVAQGNNTTNALFGLGGQALGGFAGSQAGSALIAGFLSDENAKENIVLIGKTPAGLGVYEFNYIGDDTPQTGVMAQEVELLIPEAVYMKDGFKHVNYAMVR